MERRGADNHFLRNLFDIYIPFARTKTAERLPLHTLPDTWNNFEDFSIKQEPNTVRFKKNLKKLLLNGLRDTPVCNRVNCPACQRV